MASEKEGGSARQLRVPAVQLRVVGESLEILQEFGSKLELTSTAEGRACRVFFRDGKETVFDVKVRDVSHIYQAGAHLLFLRVPQGSAVITTETHNTTSQLLNHLYSHLSPDQKKLKKQSVFSLRTEEASAKQYFQFYGYLSQQQNMLQDYVRTSTYQKAMLQNVADFHNKVVLDVGAGTGILSFFATQAGAQKVYAIEASSMAVHCLELIKANRLSDRITVIAGKVEEVDIPEPIDVVISEPMGYMLFNERMLESFIHARKWLRPGGKMFPTHGILYVAPFNDDALYMEQYNKALFWSLTSFHGIDISALRGAAQEEYFKQPVLLWRKIRRKPWEDFARDGATVTSLVTLCPPGCRVLLDAKPASPGSPAHVDTFDVRILMARPVGHTTDFTKAEEADLHKITIPVKFDLWTGGMVHGLAFWFDVAFIGSENTVWLSTAPFQPLTHWYQIRCLLPTPIFVQAGQEITGVVQLTANERQSYDVHLDLSLTGTSIHITSSYDLKNPNFRYVGVPPIPPGSHQTNPTETYWDSQSQQAMPANQQSNVPQVLSPVVHHSVNQTMHQGQNRVMSVMNGGLPSPPTSHTSIPNPYPPQAYPSMDTHGHQMQMTVHGLANAAGMINIGSEPHPTSLGVRSNPILLRNVQEPLGSNQMMYTNLKFHQFHPPIGGHNPQSVVMQNPSHS